MHCSRLPAPLRQTWNHNASVPWNCYVIHIIVFSSHWINPTIFFVIYCISINQSVSSCSVLISFSSTSHLTSIVHKHCAHWQQYTTLLLCTLLVSFTVLSLFHFLSSLLFIFIVFVVASSFIYAFYFLKIFRLKYVCCRLRLIYTN